MHAFSCGWRMFEGELLVCWVSFRSRADDRSVLTHWGRSAGRGAASPEPVRRMGFCSWLLIQLLCPAADSPPWSLQAGVFRASVCGECESLEDESSEGRRCAEGYTWRFKANVVKRCRRERLNKASGEVKDGPGVDQRDLVYGPSVILSETRLEDEESVAGLSWRRLALHD